MIVSIVYSDMFGPLFKIKKVIRVQKYLRYNWVAERNIQLSFSGKFIGPNSSGKQINMLENIVCIYTLDNMLDIEPLRNVNILFGPCLSNHLCVEGHLAKQK